MGVLESGVSHQGWLITHLLVLYYCSKPCFCKFGIFKCSHAQVSQGLDVGLPASYPMCLNVGSHCTVYIFHLPPPSLDLLILHLPFRVSVWHLSDFVSPENSLHVSHGTEIWLAVWIEWGKDMNPTVLGTEPLKSPFTASHPSWALVFLELSFLSLFGVLGVIWDLAPTLLCGHSSACF